MKTYRFTQITKFKTGDRQDHYEKANNIMFKSISCWNLNAAIDQSDRIYLWGILHDK